MVLCRDVYKAPWSVVKNEDWATAMKHLAMHYTEKRVIGARKKADADKLKGKRKRGK